MPIFTSEDFPDGIPKVNREKIAERTALLQAHPELVRRIAIPPLRQIIEFEDFKCHWNSSIARDQVIEGSDIDLGLVVMQDRVTAEKEHAFVEELREQGFTAYDSREVAEAKVAKLESLGEMDPDIKVMFANIVSQDLARIDFMTVADLETGKGTNNQRAVYKLGYSMLRWTISPPSF